MTRFSEVTAALRRKNRQQYALLAGCCFFSVLLITAYVTMMRSPTVLTVLPEGGDSRKQVMMIFVLAVIGCAVFTTYASGLFFRYKSREVGTFLALGASKHTLRRVLAGELALIALAACGLGALLGAPAAWLLWQGFRLLIVDSREMAFLFDPQAYLFALCFSLFVFSMLFVMLVRFLRRANILDVVNESRKSEPIRTVPRYYGILGIGLILLGAFLGYILSVTLFPMLNWIPPDGLSAVLYLPALFGLYMVLLHTVVNGWRRGQNRYRHLVTTSMMQFQGRQTVRNMVVVTVLVAGAYFGTFYTPILGTGSMLVFDARTVDYAFHYRADQNLPTEAEIRRLAGEMGVVITDYTTQPAAVLGADGMEATELVSALGTTLDYHYEELVNSSVFLSESAYNALTGQNVDLAPGESVSVFDDEGQNQSMMSNELKLVTNPCTGATLSLTPRAEALCSTALFGRRVLDDGDYARITQGLTDAWREEIVFFNVERVEETYAFAKALFNQIVDRSGPEAEVGEFWDPVEKLLSTQAGEDYDYDNEHIEDHGLASVSYSERDSSSFRLFWKYMPEFRVLDKTEFIKTTAVFLMLFVFIAILCFTAVIVILFTRSMTIAMTNRQVYDDLRHLGASESYLRRTVKNQIVRVFFTPILTGTLLISGFYGMILYFNDGRFSAGEAAGAFNCLLMVAAISLLLYGVYRLTLDSVCRALGLRGKK